MQTVDATGFFLTTPEKPLEKRSFALHQSDLKSHEVVVEVAGCGLCHTDLGFIQGAVKTKQELPLVLGHEISGKIIMASSEAENFIGKSVVIPAVLPCGDCQLCNSGRENICQAQKMPGNDFNGGFATHIKVPAKDLCWLPEDLGNIELWQLSVVADAITTPYQSVQRSGLKKGELAIVIGVGGVGTYLVQHAKNLGAHVIALDIDEDKLNHAATMGADFTVNVRGKEDRDVKKEIRSIVKEKALPKVGWRVFEMSGTLPGQSVAFSLLSFAGTVGIVGFTMDKVNVRLSNIMAFDADIFGNWGCKPSYYPPVVDQVLKGKINIVDNVERHPLESINEIIPLSLEHKIKKRVIFIP